MKNFILIIIIHCKYIQYNKISDVAENCTEHTER